MSAASSLGKYYFGIYVDLPTNLNLYHNELKVKERDDNVDVDEGMMMLREG